MSGAIGCVISVTEESYRFFHAVERAMRNLLPSITGLTHQEVKSIILIRKYPKNAKIIILVPIMQYLKQ